MSIDSSDTIIDSSDLIINKKTYGYDVLLTIINNTFPSFINKNIISTELEISLPNHTSPIRFRTVDI